MNSLNLPKFGAFFVWATFRATKACTACSGPFPRTRDRGEVSHHVALAGARQADLPADDHLLQKEKMTIPEAFRAAQKELRGAGLDPYYWAGFVLVE